MLAILNSLNAFYFHIFQSILMIFKSKFMVRGALSDITYLSLGLLSPLIASFVVFLASYSQDKAFSLFHVITMGCDFRFSSKDKNY